MNDFLKLIVVLAIGLTIGWALGNCLVDYGYISQPPGPISINPHHMWHDK